jgi:hypothetical protein
MGLSDIPVATLLSLWAEEEMKILRYTLGFIVIHLLGRAHILYQHWPAWMGLERELWQVVITATIVVIAYAFIIVFNPRGQLE